MLSSASRPKRSRRKSRVPSPSVGGAAHPDRHPLVVRTVRPLLPGEVVALLRLVVLRALAPLVVGDLVVVPGHDERVLRVQVLQVGVALVLRVPLPVVGQRDHLARRLVLADVDLVEAVAVLAGGVLVEVVAEVDHRVEVVALGQVPVGREPAGLQVGARDDAEPEVAGGGVVRRGGAGAADPAGHAVVEEPVEVRRAGLEAAGVHLHGVVAAGAGAGPALRDDLREVAGRGRPASGP